MGFLSKLKNTATTVATGGTNLIAAKASKSSNTAVKAIGTALKPATVATGGIALAAKSSTVKKVAATVATGGANIAASKAAASSNKTLKGINAAVNPVTQAKSVASAQQAVARKVDSGLKVMHLGSIANQLNVRQVAKDPKTLVTGYANDATFATTVYTRFKSGDFKGLGKQAFAETAQAFGGSKAQVAKAASIGESIGAKVEEIKAKKAGEVTPDGVGDANQEQLLGETLPVDPGDAPPPPAIADGLAGGLPVPLLIGAAAALLVVIVIAAKG